MEILLKYLLKLLSLFPSRNSDLLIPFVYTDTVYVSNSKNHYQKKNASKNLK